jgi:hypothetical protein
MFMWMPMQLHRFSFALLCSVLMVGALSTGAMAQTGPPSSLLDYNVSSSKALFESDGYMVGGDYWNTVKPLNTTDEGLPGGIGGTEQVMLLGSTQGLRNPNGLWPSGYRYTQTFRNAHGMTFPMFRANGWPGYGSGNTIFESDGTEDTGGAGGTSRFMFASFSPDVAGADDPNRNYTRPARYTDATRTHLVYESGFPTTAGVDFRIRAHQYTLNEQNLNDFVVLEISMVNTGEPDTDADGTVDATNVTVDGIGMNIGTSPTPSILISPGGGRGRNGFGGGRIFGYAATPDENGEPYNLFTYFKGVEPVADQTAPPEGQRAFGVNFLSTREGYTDIWNGWQFMGVKQGAVPSSGGTFPSMITANSTDKQTVFGTHPVGEGARKGWYTSSQWQSALGPDNASDLAFYNATATWYEDYGKTSSGREDVDLAPNSNFFSGGTPGDITTFTVGDPSARPNGDYKYASEDLPVGIFQPIWEDAWNPGASSGNFFDAVGYARNYSFSEAVGQGVGPYSLAPGEELTIVLVAAAGYRFEGIAEAVDAARWAWERGWDIRGDLPVPAAPDINVESTPEQSTRIRWTDVDGIGGASVDGYKVWRASQFKRTDYTDRGMRIVDNYHRQHEVGVDLEPFKDPVNPYFSPGEDFFSGDIQGSYQPAEWGDYELIAKIPASELGSFQDAANGYDYAFEDEEAITGFTYWYYVSAYSEGSFNGPQGAVPVGHIESSNMNRNGRNALDAAPGEIGLAAQWGGTYPFSDRSPDYPEPNTQRASNFGIPFTLTPPVSPDDQVAANITVTPNPYKITALNDVRNDPSSHNVNFLNLPEDYTLTILDVTGQIVFQTTVEGALDGQYTWNMFSKDGIEVASGLYIYHVEYGEGRVATGHFAIMR